MGRKVLNQRATTGDVQHLSASTDAQDGELRLECLTYQGQLPVIAIRIDTADVRRRGFAIVRRIDVTAARKKEAVQPGQQAASGATRGAGQQVSRAAGPADGVAIGPVHHVEAEGIFVHTPRGDADHRAPGRSHPAPLPVGITEQSSSFCGAPCG